MQSNPAASTYGFTYDTQGRLTSSDRYNGTATSATYLYTERDISYDRNGNILTLKRISNSIPSPLHNFTYTYDGDKLTALSGSQSGTSFTSAYLYDGNGNMTLDGNQTVRLSYDINNLVHRAKKTATGQNPSPQQDELTAIYSYFADGTKYSIKDTSGNGRIYIGPFSLARKDYQSANSGNCGNTTSSQIITLLESADVLGSDARFAFAATPQNPSGTDTTYTVAYETLYLLKDHLGSVRTITDSQGNALERNDYYPYGLPTSLGRSYATLGDKYRVRMPASFTSGNPSISSLSVSSPSIEMTPYRMLYNGKELQMVAQTRLIDYGARQYDPTIARWNGMDTMAEVTFNISPFSFCNNNSIGNIDSDGKFPWAIIASILIDYGIQVYYNYQDDKSNYDALLGDIDILSLILSAIPSGSGKVTKTLVLNAVGASFTITINDGPKFKTLENGAIEFVINLVTNRFTEDLFKKGSKHNIDQLHGKSRKSSAKAEKSKKKAEKDPKEKNKEQYQKDKRKMKKDKRNEFAATVIYFILGQNPEKTRTLSQGAAKILSEEEKRRREDKWK